MQILFPPQMRMSELGLPPRRPLAADNLSAGAFSRSGRLAVGETMFVVKASAPLCENCQGQRVNCPPLTLGTLATATSAFPSPSKSATYRLVRVVSETGNGIQSFREP